MDRCVHTLLAIQTTFNQGSVQLAKKVPGCRRPILISLAYVVYMSVEKLKEGKTHLRPPPRRRPNLQSCLTKIIAKHRVLLDLEEIYIFVLPHSCFIISNSKINFFEISNFFNIYAWSENLPKYWKFQTSSKSDQNSIFVEYGNSTGLVALVGVWRA